MCLRTRLRWRAVCFTVLAGLTVLAAGVDGVWVWTAGAAAVEAGVPDGGAAIAEPAIKLVATSAAANLVNIVCLSFFGALGVDADCRGETYSPATERGLKWRSV